MPGKRILFLCPYPTGTAAGQRFSYEQYFDILRGAGYEIEVRPFLSLAMWSILYKPGHLIEKALGVVSGFLRRLLLLSRVLGFDYIYIFREASPIGPPVFEACLFLLRRRVVYFFDDAIYIPNASTANRFVSALKWTSKIQYIVSRCHVVVGANKHLAEWASHHNPRVAMIPSTIDPEYHKPARRPRGGRPTVIGWTGSHSTAKYLDIVRPTLAKLARTRAFRFCVICDIDPGFPELPDYRHIKWSLASEIEDLGQIDIGIMPVPDGDWELGKVGFKAVQYSAMGIPSVVSSTGSGGEVVLDGRTGFVVDNMEEAWTRALSALLDDPELASRFGASAREHILAHYSVPSQAEAFLTLFR